MKKSIFSIVILLNYLALNAGTITTNAKENLTVRFFPSSGEINLQQGAPINIPNGTKFINLYIQLGGGARSTVSITLLDTNPNINYFVDLSNNTISKTLTFSDSPVQI